MKCKNHKCNNELNKKQKNFCSQSCHYEWKRNQPNKLKKHINEINKIKKYAASLDNKEDIYCFISDNISRFNTISNISESDKILRMINRYNLNVDLVSSWKDLYDYLKKPNICLNENCLNEAKFDTFTHGYYEFCSTKCLYKWRSDNMKGDKNNFHKVSDSVRKRIGKENGERLKRMIQEGTFTPNITNSWARSRCNINLNGNNIKLRSSWDAYFQLHNPTYKYESLRIPYKYKGEWHNYIIDFVDDNCKCIYEIKPTSESNKGKNKVKRNAAIKWAQDNQYNYIEINEEWFKHNYDELLVIGQPDEDRLKRLLKQFV